MVISQTDFKEERLVAELARLGVNYLSHQNEIRSIRVRAPQVILAELVCQPSSRVRVALISLLLAHPEYADHIPAAIKRLNNKDAQNLKIFYTAAVCLQEQHASVIRTFLGGAWLSLPDLFSSELQVSGTTPLGRLKSLAQIQAQCTGLDINWAGTYENAASHLLRRWEVEQTWKV